MFKHVLVLNIAISQNVWWKFLTLYTESTNKKSHFSFYIDSRYIDTIFHRMGKQNTRCTTTNYSTPKDIFDLYMWSSYSLGMN